MIPRGQGLSFLYSEYCVCRLWMSACYTHCEHVLVAAPSLLAEPSSCRLASPAAGLVNSSVQQILLTVTGHVCAFLFSSPLTEMLKTTLLALLLILVNSVMGQSIFNFSQVVNCSSIYFPVTEIAPLFTYRIPVYA